MKSLCLGLVLLLSVSAVANDTAQSKGLYTVPPKRVRTSPLWISNQRFKLKQVDRFRTPRTVQDRTIWPSNK